MLTITAKIQKILKNHENQLINKNKKVYIQQQNKALERQEQQHSFNNKIYAKNRKWKIKKS